jgi:Lrp/AsnC family transcriptional regulator, leucine-responsive regulatory protein
MPSIKLEAGDIRILRALQVDGRLTNQELAEKVGMSTSPCWRRVRRLEEAGVIRGYEAVLDRRALDLGVLAFVRVTIDSHSRDEARRFEEEVLALDEVTACWSVAGEADFLLQVVARDLDAYAEFAMNVIRRLTGIKAMHTMFALKEIKPAARLPLPRA